MEHDGTGKGGPLFSRSRFRGKNERSKQAESLELVAGSASGPFGGDCRRHDDRERASSMKPAENGPRGTIRLSGVSCWIVGAISMFGRCSSAELGARFRSGRGICVPATRIRAEMGFLLDLDALLGGGGPSDGVKSQRELPISQLYDSGPVVSNMLTRFSGIAE